MPGLSRASTFSALREKAWMVGTSPAMTLWRQSVPHNVRLLPQRLAASPNRRLIFFALASSSSDGFWPVAAHRQAQ